MSKHMHSYDSAILMEWNTKTLWNVNVDGIIETQLSGLNPLILPVGEPDRRINFMQTTKITFLQYALLLDDDLINVALSCSLLDQYL